MLGLDRHRRILLTVLQQHEPAARLERFAQMAQDRLRLRQLVVDVDHQREIDRCGRQLGIVQRAFDQGDVGDFGVAEPARQDIEHLRLHVVGEHAAGRPYPSGQSHSDVAGPGADVGDRRPRGDLQDVQRRIRRFLFLALAPLEPGRALIPHHRRISSAADRMNAGLLRREAGGEHDREQDAAGEGVRA